MGQTSQVKPVLLYDVASSRRSRIVAITALMTAAEIQVIVHSRPESGL
jgi:hypothetical protein